MCDDERGGFGSSPKSRLWLHVSSSSLSVFRFVACEDGIKEDALTAFTEERNFFPLFFLYFLEAQWQTQPDKLLAPQVKLIGRGPAGASPALHWV
jgi:hypothetical protein